ncbi:MAG: M20/M25/M40 family metallo-hydrolase, partial [Candidatus Dormiibacterota bacterium]
MSEAGVAPGAGREGEIAQLLSELVAIDSVNPTLVSGGAGEAAIATDLASRLRAIGLDVEIDEVAPGRPNVVGILPGRDSTPAPGLLLCGHTDTVGIAGMTVPPFAGRIDGDRVYGRGAFDMKAGLVAILDTTRRLAVRGGGVGDLVVAFVADEEDRSLGTEHLVERLRRSARQPAAGIITEPTGLSIVHAHKGFAWGRLETRGRAAHGSDHEHGRDAILLMGRVLSRLERLDRETLPGRRHPLLGRGSVHCGLIEGGNERSSYPDRCTLDVERRLLPGETGATARGEIEAILRDLAATSDFAASYTELFERAPLEVPAEAPIVRALDAAVSATLGPDRVRHEGTAGWADS